ncbi:Sec20-domain-containing protein [Coniophora puteana RWD-64-598 SS2]|uniref:Sec20-domain-containing protein n=1 Tax=Coniophora puteana (strain RWD-64-598) TaxID=741705 RepID=A0A5M3MH39_CONPW|nr:Sec20-domain-containing protein [Coniophora puteana RWD-64-598 SS2]EIW78377.1 Sec20-domain-containing protein [Coniophora puteana RWD-64-598 SS2]
MPPLPIAWSNETSELVGAVQRRLTDINDFQIPRLKDCRGPLSLHQNLATELREDTELLARQIEELELLVGDQNEDRTRRELGKLVTEFQQSLASLKKETRSALLTSKRAIDSQSRSQREELLRSTAVQTKQPTNGKVTEDILMKANDDVTAALQRTMGLMQKELERSVLSTQLLESSTSSLRSTSSTHDILSGLMGTSKQLITALERTDWLDRVIILAALAFFFLVVLFILKQRILDRGIRIAFWWTRFLPSASPRGAPADMVMDTMEKGSAVLASSIVAASHAASATLASAVSSAASASSVIAGSDAEPSDTLLEGIGDEPVQTTVPVVEHVVEETHDEL